MSLLSCHIDTRIHKEREREARERERKRETERERERENGGEQRNQEIRGKATKEKTEKKERRKGQEESTKAKQPTSRLTDQSNKCTGELTDLDFAKTLFVLLRFLLDDCTSLHFVCVHFLDSGSHASLCLFPLLPFHFHNEKRKKRKKA